MQECLPINFCQRLVFIHLTAQKVDFTQKKLRKNIAAYIQIRGLGQPSSTFLIANTKFCSKTFNLAPLHKVPEVSRWFFTFLCQESTVHIQLVKSFQWSSQVTQVSVVLGDRESLTLPGRSTNPFKLAPSRRWYSIYQPCSDGKLNQFWRNRKEGHTNVQVSAARIEPRTLWLDGRSRD